MNTAASFAENVPPTERNDVVDPNDEQQDETDESGESPLPTETTIIETIDHVDEEASTALASSLALACIAYIML